RERDRDQRPSGRARGAHGVNDPRRRVPSVDAVLRAAPTPASERKRLTLAIREVLASARAQGAEILDASAYARLARERIATRDVIVARGELVEIGGGFRIPDVLVRSGAKLVEVGTTNRTYVRDYANAITDRTGAILRVHASNFALRGFVAKAPSPELAALAH